MKYYSIVILLSGKSIQSLLMDDVPVNTHNSLIMRVPLLALLPCFADLFEFSRNVTK